MLRFYYASFSVVRSNLLLNVNKQLLPNIRRKRCYCMCFSYEDTSKEYKFGKSVATKRLQDLYNIDYKSAVILVQNFEDLKFTLRKSLTNNYTSLKNENVADEAVLKNANFLTDRNLNEKIQFLKRLPFNFEDLVPLLNLRLGRLKVLVVKRDPVHRIQLYMKLFQISVREVAEIMVRAQFLVGIDLKNIEQKVNLFQSYGVSADDIGSHCYALKSNLDTIRKRCNTAQKYGIDFKMYFMQISDPVFMAHINRKVAEKSILGDNTYEEYLLKKLVCTEEELELFLKISPVLSRRNVVKVDSMFKSLYSRGFNAQHIKEYLSILGYNLQVVESRIDELRNLGENEVLHLLGLNEKMYRQYCSFIQK